MRRDGVKGAGVSTGRRYQGENLESEESWERKVKAMKMKWM